MKIKKKIRFTELRNKGASSIDIDKGQAIELSRTGNQDSFFIINAKDFFDITLNKNSKVSSPKINLHNLKLDNKVETLLFENNQNKIFITKDLISETIFLAFFKNEFIKNNGELSETNYHNYFLVETTPSDIIELQNNKFDIHSWIKKHTVFINYTIAYQNYTFPHSSFEKTSFEALDTQGYVPESGIFLQKESPSNSFKIIEKEILKTNNPDLIQHLNIIKKALK